MSQKLDFCPIIFDRPFLNTVNAKIDCNKDIVSIGLGDMSHEFNFAKFHRQTRDKELPSKDEIIDLASIAMPPTDPLEQYLLDHENDMFMNERREIDEVFFKREPVLKHNLPVEILGDPPPPKGDPVFKLKPLPDNLKYAYLDEKKISMWVRHVLVPGITDSETELNGVRAIIDSLSNVQKVEVLPYHNLGMHKYEELGIEYKLKETPMPSKEQIQIACKILGANQD